MALNGIDISHWQSGMDVSKVSADFVIIKATEGLRYVDPSCNAFYAQAKASGKLRGLYHYANGNDPKAEAQFFVNNVKSYVKDAILCLDWEGTGNRLFGTSSGPAWIKTWCDEVYRLTGVKPLVYLSASYRSQANGIGDYGLWIAQYANNTPTGYQDHPWNEGAYTCAIRQYAGGNGRVSGYSGACDLDKFYGDRTAWQKYANPSGSAAKPTPAPAPQPQAKPQPSQNSDFHVGDTVVPTVLRDVHGAKLTQWDKAYTITAINGNNATLSARGQVWAVLPFSNIRKTGSAPTPAPQASSAITVGCNVRLRNGAKTYNGGSLASFVYGRVHKVSEIKGDRAVITYGGQVVAAVHVSDLTRV